MLAGVVAGVVWKVPETGHLDREPAIYWPEPRMAFDPELDSGPVLVTVEYTVTPERETAFLEAMNHLHQSRRRTGATRWELYRDGDQPDRFIELFSVPSWEEHLRQHEGRLPLRTRGRGCAGLFGSACPGGTPAAAVADRAQHTGLDRPLRLIDPDASYVGFGRPSPA